MLNKEISDMNKQIEKLKQKCEDEQATRDKDHNEYVLLRDDLATAIAEAKEGIELLKSQKAPGQFLQQKFDKIGTVMQRISESHTPLVSAVERKEAVQSLLQFGSKMSEDP